MLCVATAVPDAVVSVTDDVAIDADDDSDDCDEGRDANDNISEMINCEDVDKCENEISKDDGYENNDNDDIDSSYSKKREWG